MSRQPRAPYGLRPWAQGLRFRLRSGAGCSRREGWQAANSALFYLRALMLPVGLPRTWASVEHGDWCARGAEVLQTPTMNVLRWLRVTRLSPGTWTPFPPPSTRDAAARDG